MKILLVTMSMNIGGAETHILELARGLKKRGMDVEIASAGGVFVEELTKSGIPHHTLPLERRDALDMVKAEKGLKKLIRNGHYDIVHAHARIPAFLCGRIRKKLHFRFVTTDHLDFELTPLLKKLTNWGEHTFAVSEDLREYLLKNFDLPPQNISLTVNGVDTERFSPQNSGKTVKNELKTGENAMILHISRLDAPVCHCASALMDAMALLQKKAVLVIVGDGDGADALREKAKKINEKLGYSAIILAGAQADVRPYIAASEIVVSPSRAVMEGMASGKPVIVSGSQGHGGIFCEKLAESARKSNFCFRGSPLPTAEVLASEITELLSMTEVERGALGMANRRYIEEHYSVDIMVESQLSVYERVAQYRTGGDADMLLCGYYGYGNLGDETLLSVIICKLRERVPSIRICVLSADPKKTAMAHTVDAIDRFDLVGIAKKMQQGSLFLFGGGSLLQDKTSNRSLSYYVQLLRMARSHGMKLAIFANGIGPILREKNRERVKEALMCADSVSFRDVASLAFCEKYCPEVRPRLTFDPAILVETCGFGVKKERFGREKEKFFVVIPKKTVPDSTFSVKKAILSIAKLYEMRPVILSLFEKQDGDYAKKLAEETGAELRAASDAFACLQLLSAASLVLSSRLHGLVYATAVGTPMLAISDDEKLFSYMETIGMGEKDAFPAVFSARENEEKLFSRMESLMQNEEAVRKHLAENLPIWQARAEAEFDGIIRFLQ